MEVAKLIEDVFESGEEKTREENGKRIAEEISSGGVKLVEVIELLGPKLTSLDVQDRVMGLGFLALILSNLKSDFLSADELNFIVEFILDRLKDQHMVIPKVILLILPVIKCKNLPPGSTSKLLRQLFQEANTQSHTQRHRRAFFFIIQHILKNNIDELMEMGTDFVMGFLQAMDGEKDPRNLLLLFNMIPTILSNFPLGPFTEDFFEILSMYFPIDFNPSGGGPESELITRNDLAESLHVCLSQTNQFGDQLIPLVLEKLESSVLDAKLDALMLLKMCCDRSYAAQDLSPYLPSIWHAMRREIFMGGNEEVEKAANALIRSAFRRLSGDIVILENALQMVFQECKHHLSEPELRLSQPAARILSSIASGSEVACARVISMTLPLLYDQFMAKTSNPERRGILGIMISLISAVRPFPSLNLSILVENWDEILWMWFSLLTHSHEEFVELSLTTFLTLLQNTREMKKINDKEPQDIREKNRDLLQAHLLSMLAKPDVNREILSRVVDVLEELAISFPDECIKTSVPKLLELSKLTIVAEADRKDEDNEYNEYTLENSLCSLEALSSSFQVSKVVIPHLVKAIVDSKDRKEHFVDSLLRIVERGCLNLEQLKDFVDFLSSYLSELIKVGIGARSLGKTKLYTQLVGVIRLVIMNADAARQQELVDTFWNERVTSINLEDLAQINVIPGLLGEGILGSVRPLIRIAKKPELMKLLLQKVFSAGSDQQTNPDFNNFQDETLQTPKDLDLLANIRLYSTFLNKAQENEFFELIEEIEKLLNEKLQFDEEHGSFSEECVDDIGVSPAQEALYANMDDKANDSKIFRIRPVITFLIWIVKSLAMRGFHDLDVWIQKKVVRLLRHPVYGTFTANGFSILMADSRESMNSKSYCNYRFLYKQRIFQLSLPLLVEGYRTAPNETKANYIRALTGQLRDVPQVVLQMELNNVVPLLVGSLEYELPAEDEKDEVVISRNAAEAPLLLSSLTALMELLACDKNEGIEKSPPLLEYFMDFTPRLVRLAQYKGYMQIRILALQCLQRCAKFPVYVILPIKDQVVRDLRICLDDPKRIVRNEAVRSRLLWTLIGAPGGF